MAASINDKFTETFNGQNPASTTVANSRSLGGTTLVCQSLVGWPTASAVHFATYQKDSTGAKIAGSQTDWKGVVSGSSINTLTREGAAADSGNGIGDIVEMMPTYSWAQDLAKGLEQLHNNDGTWKQAAALNQPTITDFTNATHTHASTAQGGVLNVSVLNNPYKFSVYRNTAWTTTASFTKVAFDTKEFDTGTNFDVVTNNRFVAPVSGFYHFSWNIDQGSTASGNVMGANLYKNGSLAKEGSNFVQGASTAVATNSGSCDLQLSTSDFAEIWAIGSTAAGGTGITKTYFSGYLASVT